MTNRRKLIVAALVASFCCGGCSPLGLQPAISPPAGQSEASRSSSDAGTLYVGGAELSKYELGSSEPLRTVTPAHIVSGIAVDHFGHVYAIANSGSCSSEIGVYSGADLTLLRTIGAECVVGIVTDSQGYVYVTTCCSGLWVYARGGSRLIDRIRKFRGGPLAIDPSGNLYTGSVHGVAVYAPTGVPGHVKFSREISDGIHWVDGLSIASSGDLVVANTNGCNPPCRRPSITVYSPEGSQPILRVSRALAMPHSPVMDSQGRLYVANTTIAGEPPWHSWVSYYGPGGTQLLRKLARGGGCTSRLAIDASDNLYVANCSAVDVYSAGGGKLMYKITHGLNGALALAIDAP
jgi:hypothetical protein